MLRSPRGEKRPAEVIGFMPKRDLLILCARIGYNP
ncbi:hypothetical protein FHS78_003598 [Parvibaculum indicum]|nr:hypothetical protein [Parvibaculum indicum]